MSKMAKTILSIVLVIINYVFDAVIYPSMQGSLALQQADNPQVAFNGLQYLQFVHSYLWLVLLVLAVLLWLKEIKALLTRI